MVLRSNVPSSRVVAGVFRMRAAVAAALAQAASDATARLGDYIPPLASAAVGTHEGGGPLGHSGGSHSVGVGGPGARGSGAATARKAAATQARETLGRAVFVLLYGDLAVASRDGRREAAAGAAAERLAAGTAVAAAAAVMDYGWRLARDAWRGPRRGCFVDSDEGGGALAHSSCGIRTSNATHAAPTGSYGHESFVMQNKVVADLACNSPANGCVPPHGCHAHEASCRALAGRSPARGRVGAVTISTVNAWSDARFPSRPTTAPTAAWPTTTPAVRPMDTVVVGRADDVRMSTTLGTPVRLSAASRLAPPHVVTGTTPLRAEQIGRRDGAIHPGGVAPQCDRDDPGGPVGATGCIVARVRTSRAPTAAAADAPTNSGREHVGGNAGGGQRVLAVDAVGGTVPCPPLAPADGPPLSPAPPHHDALVHARGANGATEAVDAAAAAMQSDALEVGAAGGVGTGGADLIVRALVGFIGRDQETDAYGGASWDSDDGSASGGDGHSAGPHPAARMSSAGGSDAPSPAPASDRRPTRSVAFAMDNVASAQVHLPAGDVGGTDAAMLGPAPLAPWRQEGSDARNAGCGMAHGDGNARRRRSTYLRTAAPAPAPSTKGHAAATHASVVGPSRDAAGGTARVAPVRTATAHSVERTQRQTVVVLIENIDHVIATNQHILYSLLDAAHLTVSGGGGASARAAPSHDGAMRPAAPSLPLLLVVAVSASPPDALYLRLEARTRSRFGTAIMPLLAPLCAPGAARGALALSLGLAPFDMAGPRAAHGRAAGGRAAHVSGLAQGAADTAVGARSSAASGAAVCAARPQADEVGGLREGVVGEVCAYVARIVATVLGLRLRDSGSDSLDAYADESRGNAAREVGCGADVGTTARDGLDGWFGQTAVSTDDLTVGHVVACLVALGGGCGRAAREPFGSRDGPLRAKLECADDADEAAAPGDDGDCDCVVCRVPRRQYPTRLGTVVGWLTCAWATAWNGFTQREVILSTVWRSPHDYIGGHEGSGSASHHATHAEPAGLGGTAAGLSSPPPQATNPIAPFVALLESGRIGTVRDLDTLVSTATRRCGDTIMAALLGAGGSGWPSDAAGAGHSHQHLSTRAVGGKRGPPTAPTPAHAQYGAGLVGHADPLQCDGMTPRRQPQPPLPPLATVLTSLLDGVVCHARSSARAAEGAQSEFAWGVQQQAHTAQSEPREPHLSDLTVRVGACSQLAATSAAHAAAVGMYLFQSLSSAALPRAFVHAQWVSATFSLLPATAAQLLVMITRLLRRNGQPVAFVAAYRALAHARTGGAAKASRYYGHDGGDGGPLTPEAAVEPWAALHRCGIVVGVAGRRGADGARAARGVGGGAGATRGSQGRAAVASGGADDVDLTHVSAADVGAGAGIGGVIPTMPLGEIEDALRRWCPEALAALGDE